MKFEDLEFIKGDVTECDDFARAKVYFPNGFGLSVITGILSMSDAERPFEVAVLREDHKGYFQRDADTPILGDKPRVYFGYLTKEDVEKAMNEIEALERVSK